MILFFMKKLFGLLTIFLMVGITNAVSYDMILSKSTATAYDNVQIDYTISFDESQSVSYTLTLLGEGYNETLESQSAITYLIDNAKILSTSNIPAGNYNITLSFTTSEGSTNYRKQLTISPTPMLLPSTRTFTLICFKNITNEDILVRNSGNVPLDVSWELKGNVDITISPTQFNLPRNGERTINISLVKPVSNRNFNLTFIGTNSGGLNERVDFVVDFAVVIPNVKVFFETEIIQNNYTIMNVNLSNMGNIRQNISITVSYFTMEGVQDYVFAKDVSAMTNTSFSQNIDIPKDSKILAAYAMYIDNDGEEQLIKYDYGIFGIVLPSSVLNAFATIWSNSTYRGLFIAFIGVVIIYLIYTFYLKKKIFRKKH